MRFLGFCFDMGDPPSTFISGYRDESMCTKMKYNDLGKTGMKVSKLGLGCSAFGGVYGTVDEQECYDIIEYCLKNGINYIDTAPWYGNSEQVIGRGLTAKKIPRNTYYIATKVGRYPDGGVKDMFNFTKERVEKSIEESLKRLCVDYIDLVQVHDMEFAPSLDIIINETLPALNEAKKKGLIRHIGITGYPLDVLESVLKRSTVEIDTILSYCRYSMNDTSLLDYLPFFKSQGVGIINASPNSMGLLSSDGPPDWHPADDTIKNMCGQALQYAKSNSVPAAKLALDFSCSHPDVHTTLVSASRMDYMKSNLHVILNGVTDHEKKVQQEMRTKYFIPLKNHNWEGVEVAKYRAEIG
ncbi:uncharacterized protein [Clytia hemisphaerica]|uniref:NADP-dependent oxidoreductase domain-containing protein n=1 Tax=Clytia hemisphaerica TaxID=252671 RepID=A0A7M5UT84_9CNID